MQRYRLAESVRIEGYNVRGVYSVITLEPQPRGTGWLWETDAGAVRVTPDIMQAKRRCVALVYKKHILYEFEHIGILRAAGLEDVLLRVTCASGPVWPPYDSGSSKLWDAVKPHLVPEGELLPWEPTAGVTYTLAEDQSRHGVYTRGGSSQKFLQLSCYLLYKGYQEHRWLFRYPEQSIQELIRARTLGWPKSLWWASKTLQKLGPVLRLFHRRWPHHHRIVWPQEACHDNEWLRETAQHRLLDMLGVLAFVPPLGHYLTGSFHSVKGGHALDVPLAQELYRKVNVVAFTRVA